MATFYIGIIAWSLLSFGVANALTVDEIIKLKQAGVSEATIQMLIERSGDARSAGTWRTNDGWIVHSTEIRDARPYLESTFRDSYPINIYPEVSTGRRTPPGRARNY